MSLKPQADKVLKAFRFSRDASNDARIQAEKAWRYVNNDPWEPDDKASALAKGKPTLRYNIIKPVMYTLLGNEQRFRRRAKFKPTSLNPKQIKAAEILQGRWNAINDEQEVEDLIQLALWDALVSRIGGWIERCFSMTSDGYLDFEYKILNNMRIYHDQELLSSDYKLKNCRYIIKEGWLTLDEIKDKYVLDTTREKNIKWYDKLNTILQRLTTKDYSKDEDYDSINDTYRVLEMQERTFKRLVTVWDGESSFTMTPSEYKKNKDGVQLIQESTEQKIHITTVVPFFDNQVVVDEDAKWDSSNFDVFPIWSSETNVQVNEGTSLVELLEDVQDDFNKAKSQTRDYVSQMLSQVMFYDKRDKDLEKNLKQKKNQPFPLIPVNNLTKAPTRMTSPGQIPPDILSNAEHSVVHGEKIAQVTQALKGGEGKSGESAKLFEAKLERAGAAVNPYYHNVSRLRKFIAQDFADNFSWVYSELDRPIRIKSDSAYQDILINLQTGGQILDDIRNASITVELDEGEDNITVKEDNFEKFLALFNMVSNVNPQIANAMLPELIASAPVFGIEKIKNLVSDTVAKQNAEQDALAKQQRIKESLDNLSSERGLLVDEEKIARERASIQKQQ